MELEAADQADTAGITLKESSNAEKKIQRPGIQMPRLRKQNVCTEAHQQDDSSEAQKGPVVSVVQEVSEHGTGGVR